MQTAESVHTSLKALEARVMFLEAQGSAQGATIRDLRDHLGDLDDTLRTLNELWKGLADGAESL